jgi:hypothetical protein
MPLPDYLLTMFVGYLMTIAVETAVLLVCLSRRHSVGVKLFAGVWLTACTYPVVWLVLPPLFEDRWLYLLVAETFAPVAECAIFWFTFIRRRPQQPTDDEWWWSPRSSPERRATLRDMAAITLANLCSFGMGELIYATGWYVQVAGTLRVP